MKRFIGFFLVCVLTFPVSSFAQSGGQLRFCLRADPKTFDPLLVEDEPSEAVRYLTGGVLLRLNRKTQVVEPELATSWKVSANGREISFRLREGVSFSDNTPFSVEDVKATLERLLDPNVHSPTGDAFRSSQEAIKIQVSGEHSLTVVFPAPVAGLERLFDQVAISSSRSSKKELAVLGPFYVHEYQAGSHILLKRNPNYWKRDEQGLRLPYLDSIRLDIQSNRDLEILRFRRGEIQLINALDSEYLDRLNTDMPAAVHDAGPSLDSEQLWFNQVSAAPVPAYKKAWFDSQNFRRAISEAVNRADLCKVVFGGHAHPAIGPVSPANRFWFNQSLHQQSFDPGSALRRLQQDSFYLKENVLYDREGHAVEFSIITNAGNKSRERMGLLMQQDLSKIGIRINVTTLDFPSLIERITRTFNYEACLLGLVNVDLDPSSQMNVWLSSSANHQWNPEEKSPATPWEVEIDELMRSQASTTDAAKRKGYFDRVQQVVWEQAPFIYLVNKDALSAVSPVVEHAEPVILRPQTFWNAERLSIKNENAEKNHDKQ